MEETINTPTITLSEIILDKIQQNYQFFIENIKYNIGRMHYRKVLFEIEALPPKYKAIPEFSSMLLDIKIKCIWKIIRKKMHKSPMDNKDKQKKHWESIEFWFNQLYLIVNQVMEGLFFYVNNLNFKVKILIIK